MISKHHYSKEYLDLDLKIAQSELEIKKVIQSGYFRGLSKKETVKRATAIVVRLSKAIHNKELREQITNSLKVSIERWTKSFFTRDAALLTAVSSVVLKVTKSKKLIKSIHQNRFTEEMIVEDISNHQLDYFHHGFPHIEEYFKKLKQRTIELADAGTYESYFGGVRRVSLFAKAERELRHESNTQMIKDMIKEGHRYCWISAHSDCSERCKRWQGKLVDLVASSVNSKFETGERLDGHVVYSLKDITDQVDKYGYKNNIIVGFNCRHYLIPYTPRSTPPFERYPKGEVDKERKINQRMRSQERRIRRLRERSQLMTVVDPKEAKTLHRKAIALEKRYIAFAKQNRFAYYPQRIKVSSW